MQSVNLLSFLEAWRSLSPESFAQFAKMYGIVVKTEDQKSGNELRCHELRSMATMVDCLLQYVPKERIIALLDTFYLGYIIPHIGCEMDLLKIGDGRVLNIEVKSKTDEDRIREQLSRHAFYLRHLSSSPDLVSFDARYSRFFYWNHQNEDIEPLAVEKLVQILETYLNVVPKKNIEMLFHPSRYMVSPFNRSSEFVEGRYFLTQRQQEIKRAIQHQIEQARNLFYSVSGGPGTGKSLLLYDIAREFKESGKEVLIVHCGNLNSGHEALKELGWKVISAKKLPELLSHNRKPYAFFIDEAQRFKEEQFEELCAFAQRNTVPCIFFHDGRQKISALELLSRVDGKIEQMTPACSRFSLSKNIRSNDGIMCFIEALLSERKRMVSDGTDSITVEYYEKTEDVKARLVSLKKNGYAVINYTPSHYTIYSYQAYNVPESPVVHDIIGQEFEKVVVVIDDKFRYSEQGVLECVKDNNRQVYLQDGMMYQIATRAISHLQVLVLNNNDILLRCCCLLSR